MTPHLCAKRAWWGRVRDAVSVQGQVESRSQRQRHQLQVQVAVHGRGKEPSRAWPMAIPPVCCAAWATPTFWRARHGRRRRERRRRSWRRRARRALQTVSLLARNGDVKMVPSMVRCGCGQKCGGRATGLRVVGRAHWLGSGARPGPAWRGPQAPSKLPPSSPSPPPSLHFTRCAHRSPLLASPNNPLAAKAMATAMAWP